MTHYIVVSSNEIVKAEMERPERHHYESEQTEMYLDNINSWKLFHRSLPRIAAPGHMWELWQEVVEGRDFEFNKKPRGLNNEGVWCDLSDAAIKTFHPDFQLIAIPIQPTPEPKKGIDLVEMQKRFDEALTDESVQEYINKYPERFKQQPTPEGEKVEERILCAAIWYQDKNEYPAQPKNIKTGYVWCGRRHNNIIILRAKLLGEPTRRETSVQGFITNLDRFVDRIEGNVIAINAKQVTGNENGDELISEDLY